MRALARAVAICVLLLAMVAGSRPAAAAGAPKLRQRAVELKRRLGARLDKAIGARRQKARQKARKTPRGAEREWRALKKRAARLRRTSLRKLFADDPGRADRMTLQAGDLTVDFSKHLVDQQSLDLLVALAEKTELPEKIEAMFSGARINSTEDRAVLHTALRAPRGTRQMVDGVDINAQVHAELDKMAGFTRKLRSGKWRGKTGKRIKNVINIGIGGSDLGPAMAYDALKPYSDRSLDVRFVSNVDPADLREATMGLDPAETLFIVSSKTFTTVETLENAKLARKWLVKALGEDAVANHFVAVSTNEAEVKKFGIDPNNMFRFWDWVGGRYSVDSAIGLSLMASIGPKNFRAFLDGFHDVDQHFRTAPLAKNVPVLMALLGVWNGNFMGAQSHAVLPYSHYLSRFPAYLQQLDMESNGKRVDLGGQRLGYQTGPIVWGTAGTNGQHAYYQLLHQGTRMVPADFIGFQRNSAGAPRQHDLLMANMFAQSQALAFGKTGNEVAESGVSDELVPHRTFPGGQPSTTIVAPELTPRALGQLIALYEHKVFVQGAIWGVNSFDQWGVELGKVLAKEIAPDLRKAPPVQPARDSSTRKLIERYRKDRGK